MRPLKFFVVAGTRPNFIKVAPLIGAMDAYNRYAKIRFDWRLVHAGQHYSENMSRIFFAELGIPEAYAQLDIGWSSQAEQMARMMKEFEVLCRKEKPHWVVLVGDVNSTAAAALVAADLGIKVAHVEAGLRSFDRTMPEEINRVVIDALSDLLFTPSADADENLKREDIPTTKIKLVGNIMIDTLIANLDRARASTILQTYGLKKESFVYTTMHRPSNVDDPGNLIPIMTKLKDVAERLPVVFPMHPRTRKMCSQFGISYTDEPGLKVVEPIGYHDSLCLAENGRFVLTDSGGLQEETTFFRTPCLTLRPNTERPITISVGSNRLTTADSLLADVDDVLEGPSRYGEVPPLWDGWTAERIVGAFAGQAAATRISPPKGETKPTAA